MKMMKCGLCVLKIKKITKQNTFYVCALCGFPNQEYHTNVAYNS